MVTFNEEGQNKKIEELHLEEEENLARLLSEKYSVPYANLILTDINLDALRLIPEEKARSHNVVAIELIGKKVGVATIAPSADKTKAVVDDLKKKGYSPHLYIVSEKSLESAWARYKDLSFATETRAGLLEISSEEVSKFIQQTRTIKDVQNLIDSTNKMGRSHRLTRIVEVVLSGAIALGASDVHIEPAEDSVRARFRLDGVLIPLYEFEREVYELLLSRVKLLSGLKISKKEDAQDGRFSIKIDETDIEIRTSTLPGTYGESIVMRVLNPSAINLPFEELGLEPVLRDVVEEELKIINGMILNTGPTGSGKTTTLYSFLKKVYRDGIKIVTIEDPVEYHLKNIVQTQVDQEKGYSFLQGLRSVLRQDPDVIMVGEIRDKETAETAIHAALTGHLVFSTLHTNSAAGAFPRLADLGVNTQIVGSAINIVLAQRLVRKLCKVCKKEVSFSEKELSLVKEIYETIEKMGRKDVVFSDHGYRPVGCEVCGNTGYSGRIGIFEAIKITDPVEVVIRENGSEKDILEAAKDQKTLDMKQDGVRKVLLGITDLEEVRRVVTL